jgi:hypothetical protein
MPCSPPSRRRRAEPQEDAAVRTRPDFVVGVVAASRAVAATLGTFALVQNLGRAKEPTMNPSDPADIDLVTLPSA